MQQLTSRISSFVSANGTLALDESITQTIKFYARVNFLILRLYYHMISLHFQIIFLIQKGKRRELFYFLTREPNDFLILVGIKLLVEDVDTFDTDSQVILEYLCAITERVKTHEARLIWIQTSMVFAKLDLVDEKRKV